MIAADAMSDDAGPEHRTIDALARRLKVALATLDEVAIAVSGGVDSLTLAVFVHRIAGLRATMSHAISHAVPAEATARVRNLAAAQGWRLDLFDAGEFADPRYRANPVDRCFFCKTNLYGAIRRRSAAQILSGTNLDDLGEYRPGLEAAREHGVRHPYVEAGLDKSAVRALARRLGLGEIAELPAAPCLASRVESGIPIIPSTLGLIHATEQLIAAMIRPATVRCRVRATGVVIELDHDSLGRLDMDKIEVLRSSVRQLLERGGVASPISFAPYRSGSAFVIPAVERSAG